MQRTLIIGASGQVGTALVGQLGARAIPLTRSELDITDLSSIEAAVQQHPASAVINCAAFTAVDLAESEAELADLINHRAVAEMARVTASLDIPFITYSTDYVFDGSARAPYLESDEPRPKGIYGETKLRGELAAAAANPATLIIRTSWIVSRTHDNFVSTMLRLASGSGAKVVDDQWGRPTSADDLAAGTLEAVERGLQGVLHMTNGGVPTTWFRLARKAAELAGLDESKLEPCTTSEFPRPAPRPAWSVLASARHGEISPLPDWEEALEPIVRDQMRRLGPAAPDSV